MKDWPLQRYLDMPPIWLALFLTLVWIQKEAWPLGPSTAPLLDLAAGLLVGGGVLLATMAVVQMRQARTTFVPHLSPQALVTEGVFSRSRNPIYLADALILLGLILWWRAWPSMGLIPLFLWLITDRFIRHEEARLRDTFGSAYEAWAERTRRWL